MASSYTLLADLKAGRCSTTSEVRLLRFWEARNVRKGGELMSIDMLLLDEQSTLIHGTVVASRVGTYRPLLKAGSVYSLGGFDVTRSNNNFRLSDASVSIRFADGTSFRELAQSGKPIPTEMFRFRSYDQLLALANTNRHLPDILGELTAIRSTINDGTIGPHRVMLTLRIERGVNVCVSMFDGHAFAFHNKLSTYGGEPKVVLVTSINPKVVGGRVFLNATSATHFYFDTETEAGKEHYVKLFGDVSNQPPSASKLIHAQKLEAVNVSELNEYVLTADPQVIEFLCTAKVTGVQSEKGWCYIGCASCSKKLVKEISSFTCLFCDNTSAVASLRYRVELSVSDHTGDAVFVAFDMDITRLTNIKASEAAVIKGVGINATVENELPQFLSDIVGRTLTFQLKLGEFNFTSKHQTFTISRIITETQRAPLPDFTMNVQNPLTSELPPGASNTVHVTSESLNTTDRAISDVSNEVSSTALADADQSSITAPPEGTYESGKKKARVA